MCCKNTGKITFHIVPLVGALLFCYSIVTGEAQEALPSDEQELLRQYESEESEEIKQLDETSQLLRQTIYLDITTAGYYELQDWTRRLGLTDTGTRTELENRLLSYYKGVFSGIPLTTVEKAEGEGTGVDRMEIESAGRLSYEKSGEEGEIIRLGGGVLLQMRDTESNTVHTIEAQSLVFNRPLNSVSALGNVRYRMENDDSTQDFRGEEITFDIENFRGVFIEGLSSRPAEIEDISVTFYFQGSTIYRIQRDVVRLNRGNISSSKSENPYYRIAAGNVWMLGIDEWAIHNATLYIGHIPLLYIPFYYHPGDTFIFHPSIGMRSLEGYYTQTTTYFFGRKPDTVDSGGNFSFLQAVEGDQSEYEQELRGFFLHSTREPMEDNWVNSSGSFGKFQLDYYTRLGLVSGLKLDMQDLGSLKNLDITLGAAFTNYIYSLPGYDDTYSKLLYDSDTGTYKKTIQQPYVFGNRLPFRFGVDISAEVQKENFSFELQFPFYTDVLLHDQLDKRNETLQWSRFLTGEGILDADTFEDFEDPYFRQHTKYSLQPFPESKVVESIRIDKLDSELYFKQSSLVEDELSFNPLGYYYPDVFTPLDLEITMKGTLFSMDYGEDTFENSLDSDASSFKPPDNGFGEEKEMPKGSFLEEGYKIPGRGEDFPLIRQEVAAPFSQRLTYTVSPDFSYHTQYDTGEMSLQSPENVEFDPLYSYIFTDGDAIFQYNATLFQGIFSFSQNARLRARYRDHFDGEDLESLIAQDRSLSYFKTTGLSKLNTYFLRDKPLFSDSYISYEIESELYAYTYDQDDEKFESAYLQWDEESIQTHRSSLGIIYDIWNSQQKLILSYTMPPDLQKVNSSVEITTGPLRSTVEYDIDEEESDEWTQGPLQIAEDLSIWNGGSVSQNFTILDPDETVNDTAVTEIELRFIPDQFVLNQKFEWNLTGSRPENTITSLKTGWWTNRYEASYTNNYEFSTTDGWQSLSTKDFQPYRYTSELKIPYNPDPLWKNRIEIDTFLSTSLELNLIRYTESLLQFSWDTDLSIAEFLDLKLSINSANNSIYRYIPEYAEERGKETKDVFEDLLQSFNFFSTDDRKESNFNLQNISLSLIHYMHDWRLQMQYSGLPRLDELNQYEWYSEFSIFVQWNPIPEIRKEAEYGEEGLQI